MSDTVVHGYDIIKDSIIGWRNNIGKWCTIINKTATGADVKIAEETMLDNV